MSYRRQQSSRRNDEYDQKDIAHDDWNGLYRDALEGGTLDSFSETEAVLREINKGWEFMTSEEEEFDPVTLALALMDDSSAGLGKDYTVFDRMLKNLDKALQAITNDYYQGFNSSIGTFSGVLGNITDSQARVKNLKGSLKRVKDSLEQRRSDLLQLWFKSQQYKEMLNILDSIEELRTTPDRLETLLNEKHFLTATNVLSKAIKTLNEKEMIQIGALEDIRRGLTSQKTVLHETLIEELHNHLYLKNSYCDSRWSKYTPDQEELPDAENAPKSVSETVVILAKTKQKGPPTIGTSQIPRSNDDLSADENEVIMENVERNPETDSYYYMEILMESLAVLGKVQDALETIQQRLPIEIYALVDKTIEEVDERNVNGPMDSWSKNRSTLNINDIYALDAAENEVKNDILKDLLWTLYSKLEAVLRGHRFVVDCANKIKKRMDARNENKNTLTIHKFKEIWLPMQHEIRALLHDYLTDRDRSATTFVSPIAAINEVLRERKARDKNKQLFKFMDSAPHVPLERAYDAVKEVATLQLRKPIPGLLAPTNSDHQTQNAFSAVVVDMFANVYVAAGHRLLVRPDVYNVSVLIKPTMAFLERLKQIMPVGPTELTGNFSSFLDEFVLNVFLPQIEDKVLQLIHQSTAEANAFQEDPNYSKLSNWPIIKSASALIVLISSLCRTLHTMPFHKDEYIRMIELILLKYYEKCFGRFHAIVAKEAESTEENNDDLPMGVSANWAQDEVLVGLLSQNPYFSGEAEPAEEFVKALNQSEITHELKLKQDRQLSSKELIFEPKKFVALSQLYHSLKWFVRKIWELRETRRPDKANADKDSDPYAADDAELQAKKKQDSKRWSTIGVATDVDTVNREDNMYLPIKGEIAERFDTLLTTFQQLAETCLFTLRVEARCHTLFYLDIATREGNYNLEDETYEPDPYIVILNSDLVSCEEATMFNLPENERRFIFDGLPGLVVHILISNATYIKHMNNNGVHKMIRNILAIQQNLTNIVSSAESAQLDRAREYYRLYSLGSEKMFNEIREHKPQFSFDEYRAILNLIHNVDESASEEDRAERDERHSPPPQNVPAKGSKTYSEYLLMLVELMAQYEED
ncbi:hypothetical protein BC938DRAFT_476467 [Jimgerdemannia flammicorona]|uniref:Exocyst complex component Sec8 n=1 Tax=Jimgerdemannia flammicorona TaxID=994334 RepID=A0A433QQF9_9FUNG|nr:hypothetical protein BC938DRAFT_476467 [Jimgerdemannia flammicorona]RUS32022.1 hypothetical protein BC938DRAFT_476467 [Jimgerdemannia flammicorona]